MKSRCTIFYLRPAAVLASLTGALCVYTMTDIMARSFLKTFKGQRCQKFHFVTVSQHNQNVCICFSCENQWAQTDGGLFPHYLLLDSDKCPRRPSKADAAQVSKSISLFQHQTDGRSSQCGPFPFPPPFLAVLHQTIKYSHMQREVMHRSFTEPSFVDHLSCLHWNFYPD